MLFVNNDFILTHNETTYAQMALTRNTQTDEKIQA